MRSAMRGLRKLSRQGHSDRIDSLCSVLATFPIPASEEQFSSCFYGASKPDAELATRQFLYLRLGLYKITSPLFATLARPDGRLAYPLPPHWITLLRQEGVPVRAVASSVLWIAAVLVLWAYGLKTIVKLTIGALRRRRQGIAIEAFAHFEYIGEAQTPRPGPDGKSHDVMTWYRAWSGRDRDVQTLTFRANVARMHADVPGVACLPLPYDNDISPANLLRFCGWSLLAATFGLLDLLRGRWWHALMLHEAAQARFASLVKPDALARDYLFNNSGWFQRPLWTYEAEHRGSRILFYHYSTNSARFKEPTGYRPEHHAWSISNWPLHLVWDQHNAGFVAHAVGTHQKTEIVGPIWFASSPETPPASPGPAIGVFDVTPFRPSKAPSLALPSNYYTPDACVAFIEDVARASAESGMTMMWKRKRNIGKAAHPVYRAAVSEIDRKGLAQIVLADHSPVRVIEVTDLVVSVPFTSTAHLARHMGKPSCYYDPTGSVQRDDRAAHDIPILHGYDELLSWIRTHRSEMTTLDEI